MCHKLLFCSKGYKLEKTRKISLNSNDIKKAIRDLQQMKKNIETLPTNIESILDEAVTYCKSITPISDKGGNHLADNTYWTKTPTGYRITQEGENVLFVEFGTGVVGENSPHDKASDYGWIYGTGEHIFTTKDGKRGWFFPLDNTGTQIRFTQGQVANMQMYKTSLWLKERLQVEVKMVLNREVSKW